MDNPVENKLQSYPEPVYRFMLVIRDLVQDIAVDIGTVEECLKWGEVAFLVKGGSTVRLGWKPETPEVCYIYFHCQTVLIETFRETYGSRFEYQGNRAIALPVNEPIPRAELANCLSMAFRYHKLKKLPLLGA